MEGASSSPPTVTIVTYSGKYTRVQQRIEQRTVINAFVSNFEILQSLYCMREVLFVVSEFEAQ
jgi:hypothetical protein